MIDKVDFFLLCKTYRLANWICSRWGWNNYKIAAMFKRAAMGMLLFYGTYRTNDYIHSKDYIWSAFWAIINLVIIFSYNLQAKKLDKLAFQIERDSSVIPTGIFEFMAQPPWIRVFVVWLTVVFGPLSIAGWIFTPKLLLPLAIILGICSMWITVGDGVASYFAAIPPTRGKPKEKKAWSWSFGLTPQPVGNK